MKLIENSAVIGRQSTTTKKKKKNTERVGRWEWLISAGVLLRACRIEREKFICQVQCSTTVVRPGVRPSCWLDIVNNRTTGVHFHFHFIFFQQSAVTKPKYTI